MSLRLRLLVRALRMTQKPLLARLDPLRARAQFELVAALLLRPPPGTRIERIRPGGVPARRILAPDVVDGAGAVLYAHGGAFVMGSARSYTGFAARISSLTGRAVIVPDYRRAPEHRFPAALIDLRAAWDALAEEHTPGRLLLGGDSAGGNLALGLLAQLCHHGLPGPGATFAFSPFTDFADGEGSRLSNAVADPLLPIGRLGEVRGFYLGDADPADDRASPVRAHFIGAGPVWLSVGSTEVLYDDTRRMAERLQEDGVRVEVHEVADAPHVWPMFGPLLPESTVTLRALGAFVASATGRQDTRADSR